MNLETVAFEKQTIRIIDQKLLPGRLVYKKLRSLEDVISSIKNLNVRGAPAIGITAAYGLYLHACFLKANKSLCQEAVLNAATLLKAARPTAVNLQQAVDRMLNVYLSAAASQDFALNQLQDEAFAIHHKDKMTCEKIGEYGSGLIPDKAQILTHCNAGFLATGGMGTALAVIYKSKAQGKTLHVFVDETRPVGQGARLTYWELQQNNIPATLITDNMAASVIRQNKLDAIIVGADRIAANGDVANKIGTYSLAVLAAFHGIPFYVAAPLSSFDFKTASGDQIPIELREPEEILGFWNIPASAGYTVFNPAFDITPNALISALITEQGIVEKPVNKNISKLSH